MDRGESRIFMVKKKEQFEGAIYHIIHRAPGLEKIFIEDADYLKMLGLLEEVRGKYNLNIFAFVLMPNHVHLLLRINTANLNKAMHNLFFRYARYFNGKYDRKGPLFSGSYMASLCLDEVYLVTISLYIHLNPLVDRWAETL